MDRKWDQDDAKIIPFTRPYTPNLWDEDPLAAARGCAVALLIMVPVILGTLALIFLL